MQKLFTHQKNIPNQIAFSEGDRHITYQGFVLQAQSISIILQQHANHTSRIAIMMPRGIHAVLSIYATVFLGATYVPLDIQNPISRLQFIIEDVQPQCIIGEGVRPDWLKQGIAWVDIQSIPYIENTNISSSSIKNNQEDIAAILYTSGSTGNPKGVAISYRAIQAFIDWSSTTFQLDVSDRIASLAPFHFDLSLFDLFSSLSNGASTYFIPQRLTMSPKKLVDWFEENSITTWYTVPSILSFMAQRGSLDSTRLPIFKRILFAGEVFPLPNLIKLSQALPHIELYNLFGPTETNVCTYWKVQRNILDKLDSVPIGTAACSADLQISDEGELLVQGPTVMSGYWMQGYLHKNNNSWYHTGDHVSQGAKQQYLYHGRMDRMIKSSGYRIEPAEIEHQINLCDGVELSVVIGEDDAISGQRLIAIIVGKDINIQALRKEVKQRVASYMQPYRFIQLDRLPRLSNGKLDMETLRRQISEQS